MPVFTIIFLLLVTVPVLEIFLLIKIGSEIGAINTILIVIFTAFLGAFLLRKQGLSTIARAQAAIARKEIPALELIEGIILIFTGALLLTPGFFTDTIGFLSLVPAVRQWLARGLIGHFKIIHASGVNTGSTDGSSKKSSRPTMIEGEFWKEDDK